MQPDKPTPWARNTYKKNILHSVTIVTFRRFPINAFTTGNLFFSRRTTRGFPQALGRHSSRDGRENGDNLTDRRDEGGTLLQDEVRIRERWALLFFTKYRVVSATT